MTTFRQMADRFDKINPRAAAAKIIELHSDEILDLIRKRLYETGIDADGVELPGYRDRRIATGYAAMKNQMNPLPGFGTPDYKLTGEWYNQLTLYVMDNQMIFDDDDAAKTAKLLARGGQPFGLDAEQKVFIWNTIVRPFLLTVIEQETGAKVR